MALVEEYDKEIQGRSIRIAVHHYSDKPEPYYAISSLDVDGAGSTIEDAKNKCENATKMEIQMNN